MFIMRILWSKEVMAARMHTTAEEIDADIDTQNKT